VLPGIVLAFAAILFLDPVRRGEGGPFQLRAPTGALALRLVVLFGVWFVFSTVTGFGHVFLADQLAARVGLAAMSSLLALACWIAWCAILRTPA
jgi:hypothetical protein